MQDLPTEVIDDTVSHTPDTNIEKEEEVASPSADVVAVPNVSVNTQPDKIINGGIASPVEHSAVNGKDDELAKIDNAIKTDSEVEAARIKAKKAAKKKSKKNRASIDKTNVDKTSVDKTNTEASPGI